MHSNTQTKFPHIQLRFQTEIGYWPGSIEIDKPWVRYRRRMLSQYGFMITVGLVAPIIPMAFFITNHVPGGLLHALWCICFTVLSWSVYFMLPGKKRIWGVRAIPQDNIISCLFSSYRYSVRLHIRTNSKQEFEVLSAKLRELEAEETARDRTELKRWNEAEGRWELIWGDKEKSSGPN